MELKYETRLREEMEQEVVNSLATAFEPERFSDICFVQGVSKNLIRLKCPNSKDQGIVVETDKCYGSYLDDVVKWLRASVEGG